MFAFAGPKENQVLQSKLVEHEVAVCGDNDLLAATAHGDLVRRILQVVFAFELVTNCLT